MSLSPTEERILVWSGRPYPLGAVFDGSGTNVAVFSEVARRVELCLFDDAGHETRVDLPEVTGFVWHGYFPMVRRGQRYGFRVHGDYDPSKGQLCNPAKLLVDPYARAIDGELRWGEPLFGYRFADPDGPPNTDDSAPLVPRCVVSSPFFDWRGDVSPRTPWHKTVIYEAHVKGMTALHPLVPPALRGTYLGLAHPAVIHHLVRLGVSAVELMPVHQFTDDHALTERGLRNYWGYNTLGYFAPHEAYASRPGEQVAEFKEMIRLLHEAGLEVILDVVYNHTAEGNHRGPTLSFRGLDNAAYYRLMPDDPRHYMDYTGCGNSLNMRHPHVLQLIMDSLRYWVEEMHVDGFRFDLASALARELHAVDRLSAFFDIIQQDPTLRSVKLIAEPWDVGEGGYQVGNFPPQWSEWNGRYRDTIRDFWRGQDATLGEFALRFTGSSDLYDSTSRRPNASINFVTAHDGFTLRDLVSYDQKHNEANGEESRDGESYNRSWNCGVEGETNDAQVLDLRARQRRNLLTTLLFSQGVPMLLHGDELGRTQHGNNNAYCQDSPLAWVDWGSVDQPLLDYTRHLVALRQKHPLFRRRRFFEGHSVRGDGLSDIGWFRPDGHLMSETDWTASFAKSLGVFLNGDGLGPGPRGERTVDDHFYLAFNAYHELMSFRLPEAIGGPWEPLLDTASSETDATARPVAGGGRIRVAARALRVLVRRRA